MEKTDKTNKKSKSSLIVLLVAILLCVAVVLGMGGLTYAKYRSDKSVSTQTANVAKWGYVISADSSKLFGTKYDSNGAVISSDDKTTSIGVAASASDKAIVAPGTSGSMTFSITGTAEVRSKITVEAENLGTVKLTWKESDGDKTYEPIRWTLGKNGDGSDTYTPVYGWEDGKTYSDMIDALGELSVANIAPNTVENLYYKLSWAWDFQTVKNAETKDGNGNVTSPAIYYDLEDTVLSAFMSGTSTTDKDGNDITVDSSTATVNGTDYTAATSVSLAFKITVEQIQEADDPIEELVAGLYDVHEKLLATYSESKIDVTQDYTVGSYLTEPSSTYYILNNTYTDTVKIVLPDDITKIGKYAFEGCKALISVTIPDSVTSIGINAFQDCSSLESITIPDGVTSIGASTFNGCKALKSVTIGSSVTVINQYAFNDCEALTSIIIPDKVVNISKYAFEGCEALTSITIGSSVGLIGDNAFSNCKALTSVYYKGTAEQWSTLISSSYFGSGNDYLKNATRYYYSESKPTTDGNYWHYDTDGVTPVVWTKDTAE